MSTALVKALLVRCPDCKTMKRDTVAPGRHAPHWAAGVLVNCAGQPIPEEA